MKIAGIVLVLVAALGAAACKMGPADSFQRQFPNQNTGAGGE